MIKKLAVGVIALAVVGGGAWAAAQYFGPQSQAPADGASTDEADEDEDDLLMVRRGGPIEVDESGFPRLRNGLWNVTTTTDRVTMTAKICLDEAFQNEASLFSIQLNGSFCPETPVISRSGSGFTMTRQCTMGPVRAVSNTEISGDMRTVYLRETEIVTTGPGVPPETSHQREQGAFEGACPAGMAGGDMDMNGGRINARMFLAIGGAAALPTGALNELDFSRMTPPRPAE